ncbi:hypothetical protein OG349_06350 [Streptomyces sp. NBC_01317]|uniref:hypothetical protein n=1 Tax=Streptomyces sp. NBC_01317 TaxID=2903822 RepID=UPI002E0FEBE2|nr:hypothetical protein OG349_06350 [Streptomyces sp. NBC_01317]
MDSITVPEDLAQARRAWRATYQALAATSRPADNTRLRRRLLRLSTRMVRLRQQAGSSERAGVWAA